MPRTPYRTVLLDLDGTVLNTVDMILESLRHAFDTHLKWVPDLSDLVGGIGSPLVTMVRDHVTRWHGGPAPGGLVDTVVQAYLEHNLEIHDERVHPYPDAEATLDGLRTAGVRLGIVTSKPHGTARRGLKVTGLESYFEVVVGSDDVQRHKPAPEPVWKALGALGVEPETAVFVGDSPHDMAAGRAAGVDTGAALWGPFERHLLEPATPVHWLDRMRRLLELT